jgi:hemerythrin
MKWNPRLKLGVESIDSQHQTIVERIHRLEIAMDSQYESVSLARLEEAHTFLKEYVTTHFREEEQMMKEGNYPDLEAHKLLHHSFEKELVKFRENLNTGGLITYATIQLVNYLSKWFIDHISNEDPKYVPYLKK